MAPGPNACLDFPWDRVSPPYTKIAIVYHPFAWPGFNVIHSCPESRSSPLQSVLVKPPKYLPRLLLHRVPGCGACNAICSQISSFKTSLTVPTQEWLQCQWIRNIIGGCNWKEGGGKKTKERATQACRCPLHALMLPDADSRHKFLLSR